MTPARATNAADRRCDHPLCPCAPETSSDSSSSAGVAARPALARPQEVSDTISDTIGDIRRQCFVPPALARPAWQPIETVPKDRTRVLLWNGYRRTFAWYATYSDGSGGWHRQNLLGEPLGPHDSDPDTHWQALPPPPEEADAQT